MEQIIISQSRIKSWHMEASDDENGCKWRYYLKWHKGIRVESSGAMLLGQIFEWHLIGATAKDDVQPTRGITMQGKLYVEEKRAIDNAAKAKKVLKALGWKSKYIQKELLWEDMSGQMDCVGHLKDVVGILDVKYTQTAADDRFRGWGEPENMDHIQAVHYVYLFHKMYGKYIPFYFFVWGESGWCKLIRVDITKGMLETHEERLNYFREEMKDFRPKPTKNFNTCAACKIAEHCTKRVKVPSLEIIEL